MKAKQAELQKTIFEAQPKAATTALEGKTTVDDKVSIETHLVTYKAMSALSDNISKQIKKKVPGAQTFIIYNKQDIDDLKYYRTTFPILKANIEGLRQDYVSLMNHYLNKRRLTAENGGGRNPASVLSLKDNSTSLKSDTELKSAETTTIVPLGVVAGAASAVNLAKTFVDLLSIFRTDTDIKGQEVSMDEQALVAETFRALGFTYSRPINLLNPAKFSPDMLPVACTVKRSVSTTYGSLEEVQTIEFCSQTLQLIDQLAEEKVKAEEILLVYTYDVSADLEQLNTEKQRAQKKLDDAEKQIDKLKDELDKASKPAEKKLIQKKIDRIITDVIRVKEAEISSAESEIRRVGEEKYFLDKLQAHNQKVERFIAAFTNSDEKTGRSEFLSYLKAENFSPLMDNKESYWLELRAVKAGGNNRTRKNLVLYVTGAKIDHSGGMIAEWQLYRPDGTTIDGNTDRTYEGYVSPKTIKSPTFKDKVKDQ